MEGVIITIEKEELENIVCRAVESALDNAGLVREQNDEQDLNELVMKSPEVCRYLKMKISTLYQLTHKRKIPFNKKGKTMYFKKDEIDKWIAEGRQETVAEQNLVREMRISVANKKRFKKIV
jgi:excisionase family DNA binding protein